MSIVNYTPSADRFVHTSFVDFMQRVIPKTIHVVQYDKSLPVVEVSLFKNDTEYELPLNVQSVKIRFGKPDGTGVYKEILGISADRKKVYFDVDFQMAYYPGMYYPVIEVVANNGDIASSSSIPIGIDPNPIKDTTLPSMNEYPELGKISNMQVTVETIAAGLPPVVVRIPHDNYIEFHFKIPQIPGTGGGTWGTITGTITDQTDLVSLVNSKGIIHYPSKNNFPIQSVENQLYIADDTGVMYIGKINISTHYYKPITSGLDSYIDGGSSANIY